MEKNFSGINKIFKIEFFEKIKSYIKDGTFRSVFEDWKWIFRYTKNNKNKILIYTLLGILSSTMALVYSYISRTLINVVTEKQTDKMVLIIAAYFFTAFFTITLKNIVNRYFCKFNITVKNEIQKEIFENIMDSDWLSMNQFSNGDIVNRFDNDVELIANYAIKWIPDLIVLLYTFFVTLIVMLKMDPIMALIALLSAPFLLLMSKFVVKKMREYQKASKEMQSKMMAFAVETFYNTDIIKSFGIIKNSTKKLVGWQKKNEDVLLESNMFEIKTNIATSIISFCVSATAFGYCLFRLWQGVIKYGDMSFFLSRRSTLSASFKSLIEMVPQIIASAVAASRVRELVELKHEQHDNESLTAIKKVSQNGLTVRMDNVSFRYNDEKYVYENGCFVAKPNEIIALLGPSGEGKTTMLRLILALIHPESGEITLEGNDGVKYIMNADMRSLFSYVPQGNTMLSGSIADNLRLIKPEATDEEIIDALKMSCAWEFVCNLPDGINSLVGEKGKGLSEGQAQRVAIARAILNDAPVLLFDEATSALDEETEANVLKNIIFRRPDKTCIVSTHRKSVLKQCNRIYVIKDRKTEEYKSLEEYVNSQ